VPFAVIGAVAMAVRGVARSTRDLDLLSQELALLAPATWRPLEQDGIAVTVRAGDRDDPLAGVVRLGSGGDTVIDIVVGRERWQAGIIARATPQTVEGVRVPVATAADLILLKLYAGGPQDAWDVEQLLAAGDRDALSAEVEASLAALPADARRLWARIIGPR
jgi:hypothetical protein